MDDKRFDDLIKGKLEGYESEAFDPSALADLRLRLAGSQALPWYVLYRTELLVAAAVVIICLFNGGLFYLFTQQSVPTGQYSSTTGQSTKDQLTTPAAITDTIYIADTSSQKAITALSKELKKLMRLNQLAANQMIVANKQRFNYQNELASLEAQMASLTRQLEVVKDRDTIYTSQLRKELVELKEQFNSVSTVAGSMINHALFMGESENLDPQLLRKLRDRNLIVEEDGNAYLVANDKVVPFFYKEKESGESLLILLPIDYDEEQLTAKLNDKLITNDAPDRLPVKLQREIEKHYRKGVGIKIGPSLGMNRPFFEQGQGDFNIGHGINADFILSPSLSLTTGINYAQIKNEVEGNTLNEVIKPRFDPNKGELVSMELETEYFEIPLSLKYRHPVGDLNLFGSLGASAVIYTSQVYDYGQEFNDGDNLLAVSSGANFNPKPSPFAFIDVSVGVTKNIKKQNSLEFSLTYQKGIDEMGVSEMLTDVFGVKTAYWFKLR
ncbi:hypothetical protein E1176_08395 [Fulvivirga sp. RKSG066]|uniref:outer membrane beta-barrel protein n=1 Tax=Fulvivirga aurantia TaxID=2529383 RepID=UPI0012BC681E|nr:hypothetical protein [Fulvivirga aurantia]MTI21037.1 hypothetical protein [Fulvivirga aurantia]